MRKKGRKKKGQMGAVARGGEEGKKDKSYEYDAVVVVQNELQGDQKLESAKKKDKS